jgi:hypothetical protein
LGEVGRSRVGADGLALGVEVEAAHLGRGQAFVQVFAESQPLLPTPFVPGGMDDSEDPHSLLFSEWGQRRISTS